MATEAEDTKARFSTGVQDKNEAPRFSWEVAVPDDGFWRSFHYPTARNFLQCFTESEVQGFRLNEQYGDKPQPEKLNILASILDERIENDEESLGAGKRLWETDHARWQRYMLALSGIYSEQGDQDKQLQAIESLIEHRVDTTNLSFQHALAGLLVQRREFARAEELEREAMPWIDSKLGRDSPQSMSSRRILVKALIGQDKKQEADDLIVTIWENITLMKRGQYAMYVDEEARQTEELAGQI